MLIVKTITAKSILTPSKLPDTDYVINPYIGCSFGCIYCYASFMGRFVEKTAADWGNYVFVKINAPELLKKEVKRLKNKGKGKTILFSSVTDAYQGIEAKYKITRQCLKVLLNFGFAGTISILTKSPLVLRDLDILTRFQKTEVGLTITTTNDKISRYFERKAPTTSQRLKALKKLNQAGIQTYVFIGPLLPHFATNPNELNKLFSSIAQTGTKEIYAEHINLKPYIKTRLHQEMKDVSPKILSKFYQSQSQPYRQHLTQTVKKLAAQHHLLLRLNEVIYHPQ